MATDAGASLAFKYTTAAFVPPTAALKASSVVTTCGVALPPPVVVSVFIPLTDAQPLTASATGGVVQGPLPAEPPPLPAAPPPPVALPPLPPVPPLLAPALPAEGVPPATPVLPALVEPPLEPATAEPPDDAPLLVPVPAVLVLVPAEPAGPEPATPEVGTPSGSPEHAQTLTGTKTASFQKSRRRELLCTMNLCVTRARELNSKQLRRRSWTRQKSTSVQCRRAPAGLLA